MSDRREAICKEANRTNCSHGNLVLVDKRFFISYYQCKDCCDAEIQIDNAMFHAIEQENENSEVEDK